MATFSGDVQYSQVMGHLPTPEKCPTTSARWLCPGTFFRRCPQSVESDGAGETIGNLTKPAIKRPPQCSKLLCRHKTHKIDKSWLMNMNNHIYHFFDKICWIVIDLRASATFRSKLMTALLLWSPASCIWVTLLSVGEKLWNGRPDRPVRLAGHGWPFGQAVSRFTMIKWWFT